MAAPRKLNKRSEQAVVKAYVAGKPLGPVAEKHGITLVTVRNIAKRNGVTLRKVGRPAFKVKANA